MRVTISDQQILESFAAVQHSPAVAESAAVVARGGRPVEMLQAMALSPALLRGFAAICEAVYPGGDVEREIKEIIILEASRTNACQFCTESHIAVARQIGMDPLPLTLLDRPQSLSPRQRAALSYTRAAMADSNRIPESVWTELRSMFREVEIVDVTAMIGLINMLNLFNNCLQVRYHGDYDTK